MIVIVPILYLITYFGVADSADVTTMLVLWNNNDDHYDLFEVGLLKFIAIYIKYEEYKAIPEVLSWADNLLSAYSDRLGIIVSHKLLG